ncbi:DUF1507 family protein [Gemella haemolysans]|jgi:UPF0358 protein BAA_4184|uniref:DUF1507 family protein n=1 Tax=Gemella haemolysans TaxID=1379 RepID=A0AAW6B5T8_9BACL|nr:DUF1507 family protein [Gemella haemolysans]MDB6186641.1 DUF1507 family protein [Gemella haemolysans]MDB6212839.1 DUF1507 family protein [Gemella haemolysans]MDU4714795.1 DUF1507 family protein [Gemella haemolysans]
MENNLIFIKVRRRIEEDVVKIEEMINACVSVKGQRKCPLYQDVIDTQIYGLTKEINLAVEIGCISQEAGRIILADLENKASEMYSNIEEESKAN